MLGFFSSTSVLAASLADFTAGNFPIFGNFNFQYGINSAPFPTTIQPNPAETLGDFSARFTAWLKTYMESIYGVGNIGAINCIFSTDGVDVFLATPVPFFVRAISPLNLPALVLPGVGIGTAALGCPFKRAAPNRTSNLEFTLHEFTDEARPLNYNQMVNNYPGSGYTSQT